MRTFSLIKGLPVYNQKSGEKIGEVVDLCISKSGLVKGLLVKKGVFLKQLIFLAIDQISSYGSDGIMIDRVDQLEKLKDTPEYTFSYQHSLEGKMLVSKSGDSLGLLKDVYFLEELGTIVGYEVTDGFFTEITQGKQVIETEAPPAIGKDAIIVDELNR
ncbi:PRC-barrel domain-containing protein [Bacillota bacterium Lsc_1132]